MQRPVPTRPLLPQVSDMMDAAARAQGMGALGPRSAFTAVNPQAPVGFQDLPQIALFSQMQHLFPQGADLQQLAAANASLGVDGGARGGQAQRGRQTKSNDSKSSSAYASRHQAAEQRRRTRINERLDRLRKLVPHAERANTATFLEEVINYITELQGRVMMLEALHKQQAVQGPQGLEKSALDLNLAPGSSAAAALAQAQAQFANGGQCQDGSGQPRERPDLSNATGPLSQMAFRHSPATPPSITAGSGLEIGDESAEHSGDSAPFKRARV